MGFLRACPPSLGSREKSWQAGLCLGHGVCAHPAGGPGLGSMLAQETSDLGTGESPLGAREPFDLPELGVCGRAGVQAGAACFVFHSSGCLEKAARQTFKP